MFCQNPRKEAVANFRLKTVHDCMAEHLNNIGILQYSIGQICNSGIINPEHLLKCPEFDKGSQ